MRCSKARQWISADMDNGLKLTQKRALEEHLHGCHECRILRKNFEKIKAAARGLDEFSPSGQAWLKIASRLKDKQIEAFPPVREGPKRLLLKPGALAWTAGAALLLAAVFGAAVLGPKIWKRDPGSQKYVLSKLNEAEFHYQKAIEALWLAVSSRKEDFDPQLYAVFQKNLDIIDRSIAACKEAVLSRPDNLDTRNFLLAAYKEKRNLLEEMMTAGASPVEQRDVGSIY